MNKDLGKILFQSIISKARNFKDFNFREYAIRKARTDYQFYKTIQDEEIK